MAFDAPISISQETFCWLYVSTVPISILLIASVVKHVTTCNSLFLSFVKQGTAYVRVLKTCVPLPGFYWRSSATCGHHRGGPP